MPLCSDTIPPDVRPERDDVPAEMITLPPVPPAAAVPTLRAMDPESPESAFAEARDREPVERPDIVLNTTEPLEPEAALPAEMETRPPLPVSNALPEAMMRLPPEPVVEPLRADPELMLIEPPE